MGGPYSTDVAIRKWRPSRDGETVNTGQRLGLYIRGYRSGTKTFLFRVGRDWIKVGHYPEMSLAVARELVMTARRLSPEGYPATTLQHGFANAKTGSDLEAIVRGTRIAALSGAGSSGKPTYDDVWREWWKGRELSLQEGPSRNRPLSIHTQHVNPVLGRRPISDIKRREIFDLLEPLFRKAPVTAGHALGHISAVFERAVMRELVEANPTPPKSAFADAKPRREVAHHGTISHDRLPELWMHIFRSSAAPRTKLALLTAMVTAHRVGVIVHAEWKHLDLASGVWTVPKRGDDRSQPGRMKSGREYRIRLPKKLLKRLLAARDDPEAQYVFESPTTSGPVSPNALYKIIKSYDPTATIHGLRNTFKVWCRMTEPPVQDWLADAFCDHSLSGLDAAYRRADTFEERSLIAERLYDYVTSLEAKTP